MRIEGVVVITKSTERDSQDFLKGLQAAAGNVFKGFTTHPKPQVSLKLISADKSDPDPKNKYGAKIGSEDRLRGWDNKSAYLKERKFQVIFEWDEEDFGTPGAILVNSTREDVFYLKSVTLENVPGRGDIHFLCNSWVYKEHGDRIFFANKAYLPDETPEPLRKCREEELRILRGNGEGELKESDRVYDYAVYNDLGDPDKNLKLERPILGGSLEFPYPRRGRTSRPSSTTNPRYENRDFGSLKVNIYVPRDEKFDRSKRTDFISNGIKGVLQDSFQNIIDWNRNEFDSFEEVYQKYEVDHPSGFFNPSDFFDAISRRTKFPMPEVIKANRDAWRTDEEFAREMLAGLNPLVISLLKEFPPTSKLDPRSYGHQHSSITKEHIEYNLGGLTVEQALESNRLFILDHHDSVIPYLRRINDDPDSGTKTYASRTLLFLKNDSTLKPVAIELSLPHEKGDRFGVVSKVYTPAKDGVEGALWQLAKAYVAVADSGYHQLISHWLNTHAAMEPFIIATNRQLSVVHPIYKLLYPHFKDTMAINALAREALVNAGGVIESTFYPGKYSMEISSVIYRSWNFLEQSLPNDLKKRGIAVGDINSLDDIDSLDKLKKKLKNQLVIKDYPYAEDGLMIWFAIKKWVSDYCSFYYKTDRMLQQDPELQAWWKEIREVGHGDKKDEPWWPKMQTRAELIESCTTIIWIASALHSAVNFGQYDYAGFSPNRPTGSRRFMPEKGTPEYDELEKNPDKAFLKTITPQNRCFQVMTVVEILSQKSSEESYLGEREENWTKDDEPSKAFKKFHERLAQIEEEIIKANNDEEQKNRVGPVKMPYSLLIPTPYAPKDDKFDLKGIPNSISI